MVGGLVAWGVLIVVVVGLWIRVIGLVIEKQQPSQARTSQGVAEKTTRTPAGDPFWRRGA